MEATVINPSQIKPEIISHSPVSDMYSKMMYEAVILSLILTWFPSKVLSYASPIIIIGYTFIIYRNYQILFTFSKIFFFGFLFIGLNYLLRSNYIFSNGLLSLFTYGSFLLAWSFSQRGVSPWHMRKIYNALYFTIAFQSILGLLQFLLAYIKFGLYTVDMGDFIQGTIMPFSFNMTGDRGIGNAYFVINILIMMLVLLTDQRKNKRFYKIIALGSITVILAGVHHALISFFLGLFVALLIAELKRAIRYVFLFIPAIAATLTVFYFLNPNNVYLYSNYFNLYSSGESFKTIAMKRALIDLNRDHPDVSFFGTGPGQFSSRAGLLASGTYLGGLDENRSVPFFPIEKSEYFKNYAFDIYYSMKMDKSTVHGAASRTFFSLMSIYVELGMALSIGIVIYLIRRIILLKKRYKQFIEMNFIEGKTSIIIIISAVMFFIFISFFENYLEMTQATMTSFLLIKILCNNLNQYVPIVDKKNCEQLIINKENNNNLSP